MGNTAEDLPASQYSLFFGGNEVEYLFTIHTSLHNTRYARLVCEKYQPNVLHFLPPNMPVVFIQ